MENYPILVWLLVAFIGLIAIAVCMNERNLNKYYKANIELHKGFCPYKYNCVYILRKFWIWPGFSNIKTR